jgi:hypothetical protein
MHTSLCVDNPSSSPVTIHIWRSLYVPTVTRLTSESPHTFVPRRGTNNNNNNFKIEFFTHHHKIHNRKTLLKALR